MARRLTLHHPFAPWAAPPDQIARTLVGRSEVLRNLLEKVQAAGQGATPKHCLLVGPRGMGKTHLLCFLHHYVLGHIARADLPHPVGSWCPVLFAEETYPQLNTLANLLLALLQQLAEAEPGEPLWQVPASVARADDPVVVEFCLERIRESFARDGRRLLLLVDNLQKVLEQLPLDDHHRLRAFLNDQQAVMLVGSAPTYFNLLASYGAPFYDYFEPFTLRDLSPEEMLEMLGSRFREDGQEEEFERRQEELRGKIPALRKLTGGNPRLLLFLYDIVSRSAFIEVEATLRGLIEEVTDYFRARYDALAPQPRKVLDTLAGMEGPATPTEIARAARLPVQTVNAQLQRLRDHVERVKSTRKRETRYDVSERLFRIWRQTATAAGRRRFKVLAGLLEVWYSSPEEMGGAIRRYDHLLHDQKSREERLRTVEGLYYFQEAARTFGLHYSVFSSRIQALAALSDYSRADEEVATFLSDCRSRQDKVGVALGSFERAWLFAVAGRTSEALPALEQVVAEYAQREERALRRVAANALVIKGFALGSLGRFDEAVAAFDEVVAWWGEGPEALAEPAAWALFAKGEVLGGLGRFDEAVAAYDGAVARYGERPGAALAQVVASALVGEGLALVRSGRREEAVRAWDEVMRRYDGWTEADVVAQVAWSLIHRGVVLQEGGSSKEAMAVWDEVVARYGERPEPELTEAVARALTYVGVALAELGHLQPALRALAAALGRARWQSQPRFRDGVALILRLVLDRSPVDFRAAVALVEEKAVDPDLRDLLRPFSEAVRYAQTGDPAILDRLFPEVRELVLEIAQKLTGVDRTSRPSDALAAAPPVS